MNSSRQLAAIMFTDIVGYTALMGEDEHGAMQVLEEFKELAIPIVEANHGRWLKDLGDGAICSFGSALDAVNAAIHIQQKANQALKAQIRIGIHSGDVTFKEGDVFGDGVNIASRIQSEAVPGGICLSEPVYKSINNQQGIQVKFQQKKQLKNVREAVKLYQVTNTGVESSGLQYKKVISVWQAAILATILAVISSLLSVWYFSKPEEVPEVRSEHFDIVLAQEKPLALIGSAHFGIGQTALTISADSKKLVYAAQEEQTTRLYLRSLQSHTAYVLEGTDGAYAPFFSPDGNWVGFFAQGYLKKVSPDGGSPIVLCEVSNPNGGAWAENGKIYFANEEGSSMFWCPQEGGKPQELNIKGAIGYFGELSHPSLIGENHMLISSSYPRGISIISIDSGKRTQITDYGNDPWYLPTGHLVFTQYGRLMVVSLDTDSKKIQGEVVSILDDLRTENGTGQYAVSNQGTMIYVPGVDAIKSNLILRSFEGEETTLPLDADYYGQTQVSPDGEMLVLVKQDIQDVYAYHMGSETITRLTQDDSNINAVWGPEVGEITFASYGEIKRMPVTGAQDPTSIFPSTNNIYPHQWSSDGKVLMYGESNDQTEADIKFHFTDGTTEDMLLTPNRATETLARFSPKGDYIAYTSSESGTYEVYVQPFPLTGDRWVVSSGGGEEPVWAPDGEKLYYRNRDTWMEVKIIIQPVFGIKERKELFSGPYNNVPGYSYDITPDGKSFVLLKPVSTESTTTRLKVIKNWFQEVKRVAPADNN